MSVHTIPNSFSWRHDTLSGIVWTATARDWNRSFTHTEHIVPRRGGWPRGFGAQNFSPHSWISPSVTKGFQSSLLLIHFRYGPNTCSSGTKGWHRTYPIGDAPLRCRDAPLSARHSFVPLQKSRPNHRSYCQRKPHPVWFACRRKSYPVQCACDSTVILPFLVFIDQCCFADRALPCCVHLNPPSFILVFQKTGELAQRTSVIFVAFFRRGTLELCLS